MVYFKTKNPNMGYILGGLGIDNVGIIYGHLVWLWPFGILYGRLVYFVVLWYFFRFGLFGPRKIWQPCSTD
jgi:hypothetical protein